MSVYQDLRELIVSGDVGAGEVMTEHQLAERLSVSRTPVREALKRLAGDGLVSGSGRGIRILVRTGAELEHVYRTRAALEAMTAERAAERQKAGEIAAAQFRALERITARTEELTAQGEMAAAAVSNREFHEAVSALSGNPVALEVLERLWDQILVSTRLSLTTSDRTDTVGEEHRRIIECVLSGDGPGAARAASDHVLSTLAAPGTL